jgi:hypothetical protein
MPIRRNLRTLALTFLALQAGDDHHPDGHTTRMGNPVQGAEPASPRGLATTTVRRTHDAGRKDDRRK